MPTGHLYSKHQEFVTKVLLSDLLIKIYADHFKMEFEEAEKHIQDTPNAPEI